MEAADTSTTTPADDPFETPAAGDPFEEAQATPPADAGEPLEPTTDPAAAEAIPAEDIPVVDREGQPVVQDDSSAAAEPDAPAAPEAEAAAQPEAPAQPAESAQEAESAPEAAPEPQASGDGAQEPPQPPAANGAQDGEQGGGEEETTAPASGKQIRLYKLLYQTADGQWTEADMSTADEQYKEVQDGETWLKARNNEHALKIGFHILNRPQGGVTIAPVARSSWKPKRVGVAPPRPERERLVIE